MPGEIITAKTLKEAKKQLRELYRAKSNHFEVITKKEYEGFEHDEREDSDNHLNSQKLSKKHPIIDLAYYKYLPNRQTVYKIVLKHENGKEMEDYFIVVPELS